MIPAERLVAVTEVDVSVAGLQRAVDPVLQNAVGEAGRVQLQPPLNLVPHVATDPHDVVDVLRELTPFDPACRLARYRR